MMKPTKAAILLLTEAEDRILLTDLFPRYEKELEPKDIASFRELVYGVLENKKYYDYMLRKLSKKDLRDLRPQVLNLLRVALHLHYRGMEDYALVNEAVEMVKDIDGKEEGYVNAMLRNFLRRKDQLERIPKRPYVRYLSIRYSHPEWMVKHFIDEVGEKLTERILQSNNEKSLYSVRVNEQRMTREETLEHLKQDGFVAKASRVSDRGIQMEEIKNLFTNPLFTEGVLTVQSEPSMLAADLLEVQEGMKVLDLCAAPGTKSTAIAERLGKGSLTVNDIGKDKRILIEENFQRLKLQEPEYFSINAREYQKEWEEKFDRVLVDAPCSGLGIIRKKPDIRWNIKRADLKELAKIQREILDNAARYVRPGGRLIYSTCTLDRAENEDNADYFLKAHPDYRRVPLRNKEEILFHPIDGQDGFYIVGFERKSRP